jgi:hypothetical protein
MSPMRQSVCVHFGDSPLWSEVAIYKFVAKNSE